MRRQISDSSIRVLADRNRNAHARASLAWIIWVSSSSGRLVALSWRRRGGWRAGCYVSLLLSRAGRINGWTHDSTGENAILCAGVLLRLVPGDRDDVCVAQSLGGGRCDDAGGRGNDLPNGWNHHVSTVTHLVSWTSDQAQPGLGRWLCVDPAQLFYSSYTSFGPDSVVLEQRVIHCSHLHRVFLGPSNLIPHLQRIPLATWLCRPRGG